MIVENVYVWLVGPQHLEIFLLTYLLLTNRNRENFWVAIFVRIVHIESTLRCARCIRLV